MTDQTTKAEKPAVVPYIPVDFSKSKSDVNTKILEQVQAIIKTLPPKMSITEIETLRKAIKFDPSLEKLKTIVDMYDALKVESALDVALIDRCRMYLTTVEKKLAGSKNPPKGRKPKEAKVDAAVAPAPKVEDKKPVQNQNQKKK